MTFYPLFKALSWLGFFAAITISWVFYLKARNKERIALIEKGMDVPDAFKKVKFPWLKIGIIIIGICVGAALAVLSAIFFPERVNGEYRFILLILSGLFFGGISMIIAHLIDRKNTE